MSNRQPWAEETLTWPWRDQIGQIYAYLGRIEDGVKVVAAKKYFPEVNGAPATVQVSAYGQKDFVTYLLSRERRVTFTLMLRNVIKALQAYRGVWLGERAYFKLRVATFDCRSNVSRRVRDREPHPIWAYAAADLPHTMRLFLAEPGNRLNLWSEEQIREWVNWMDRYAKLNRSVRIYYPDDLAEELL